MILNGTAEASNSANQDAVWIAKMSDSANQGAVSAGYAWVAPMAANDEVRNER